MQKLTRVVLFLAPIVLLACFSFGVVFVNFLNPLLWVPGVGTSMVSFYIAVLIMILELLLTYFILTFLLKKYPLFLKAFRIGAIVALILVSLSPLMLIFFGAH